MVDHGKRSIRDITELRRIAIALDIPADELGLIPVPVGGSMPGEAERAELTSVSSPGPSNDEQRRWRMVRRALNQHRNELSQATKLLYPQYDAVRGVMLEVSSLELYRQANPNLHTSSTARPPNSSQSTRRSRRISRRRARCVGCPARRRRVTRGPRRGRRNGESDGLLCHNPQPMPPLMLRHQSLEPLPGISLSQRRVHHDRQVWPFRHAELGRLEVEFADLGM